MTTNGPVTSDPRTGTDARLAAVVVAAAEALDKQQGHRYGGDWLEEYRQEAEAVTDAVLAALAAVPARPDEGLRAAVDALATEYEAAVAGVRRPNYAANIHEAVASDLRKILAAAVPAPTDEGRAGNCTRHNRWQPYCSECTAPLPVVGRGDEARSDAAVIQDDLRAIMEALGISTHARPYSPHEVVQRDVLPAIAALAAAVPASAPTGETREGR